ncbi:MAG: acetoacetate decarboxylase family protein [Syntrophaceae bacterium]|nr:acetoacetate decarboxylase family protein [Syntrophaceae bacterium]
MAKKSKLMEVPFGLKEKKHGFWKQFGVLLKVAGLKVNLWEDTTFVLIDVPLNPEETKKILPLFMFLDKPYRATFFIVKYARTAFTGSYNEAALLVHVRTPLGKGVFCPWMIVNDDTAMIYGRELLGYPKKMADIPFTDLGKSITAGLTRRGINVISVQAERIKEEDNPAPVLQTKTFNFGGMGQFFSFNPIWMFKPRERIHESYSAKAVLNIKHSDYDPIKDLIADYKNPLDARIAKTDIFGSRMLWLVGFTGVRVFGNTFNLRFR